MKKNKKEIKVREISKSKESGTLIWLLFAIGCIIWGAYEIRLSESAVYPATQTLLIDEGEDKILEKYREEKNFKNTLKNNDENNEIIISRLEDEEEGSEKYIELENEIRNYNNNRVEYALNSYLYHVIMYDTYKMILIVLSVAILLFVISFLLIYFKKNKIYNIITVIEVIIIFILEIVYGDVFKNFNSLNVNLNDSIRFIMMLYPILLGYMYSLLKKDA